MAKPIVLALETSSLVSSIALVSEDKVIGELNTETNRHHSEQLVPHIDLLLKSTGIEKRSLNYIAAAIGPGSFTGLRIGLATAKALAYVLQIPVVGVSTLEGLAWNLHGNGTEICAVMDAQKQNVYMARYQCKNNKLVIVSEEEVTSAARVIEELKKEPQMTLAGEKITSLDLLLAEEGLLACKAPPHLSMPRAASIGYGALQKIKDTPTASMMDIIPNYIRKAEAEELWEKKQQDLLEK